MSEGTFEKDGEKAEDLATGDGPTKSGDEPKKNQGDAFDDVNLEPPAS